MCSLLRSREFLWQEGHTAFATKEEADEEVFGYMLEYVIESFILFFLHKIELFLNLLQNYYTE